MTLKKKRERTKIKKGKKRGGIGKQLYGGYKNERIQHR